MAGPDADCSVDLETMDVLAGSAPGDVLKAARTWAKANRPAIEAAWEEWNG